MKKETTVPKRSVGRPTKVEFSKRAYLVKSEVELAMSDKHGFVELLEHNHGKNDAKEATSTNLCFTINGPVLKVIAELHKIRALYGSKAKISISKTHTGYVDSNGKQYSSKNIYGYVDIKLS